MHFWKNLNNRGRILLLLMVSLVLLNLIVVVTTYNLKSLSKSFTSILDDRLVPSTDLALIQGYCYQNRLYLEGDLLRQESTSLAKTKIELNNQLIDSTLHKYKKTFFTDEEGTHVARLTEALQQYRHYEQNILGMIQQDDYAQARQLFLGESQQAFQEQIDELHQLSGIQLTAGQTLYEHTGHSILIIKTIAYFSLCISIVLAAQVLKVLGVKPTLATNK